MSDPDFDLVGQWLDYCLRWADRMERRHPNPMARYHDAAVDGLLTAIRTNRHTDGTLSIEYLNLCLKSKGANYTQADRRRAAKLKAVPLNDDALMSDPDVSGTVEARDFWEARKGRLSPKSREIMERFYLRGNTDREIGSSLGIHPKAVAGVRQRARKKLKED